MTPPLDQLIKELGRGEIIEISEARYDKIIRLQPIEHCGFSEEKEIELKPRSKVCDRKEFTYEAICEFFKNYNEHVKRRYLHSKFSSKAIQLKRGDDIIGIRLEISDDGPGMEIPQDIDKEATREHDELRRIWLYGLQMAAIDYDGIEFTAESNQKGVRYNKKEGQVLFKSDVTKGTYFTVTILNNEGIALIQRV